MCLSQYAIEPDIARPIEEVSVRARTDHMESRSEGSTNAVLNAIADDGVDLEPVNMILHVEKPFRG